MIRDADLLSLLREEREKQPELAKTLDLVVALITLRAEESVHVPADWPALARLRLERGEAALSPEEVGLEDGRLQKRVQEICRTATAHRPDFSESLTRIATRLAAVSTKEMRGIVAAYLEYKDPGVELEPELFQFVMTHALRPILRAYAALASPELAGVVWLRGNCPVCGGYPDFAALDGSAGGRRLLCARCDSEWTYRRIGCPFCENEDPATLGYFPIGDGAYRLYVCERCKGYLKTIDRKQARRAQPLPLERLLTVGMDLAAAQQKYQKV